VPTLLAMVMGMERRGRLRALVADPRVLDAALVLGCLALTALAVKGSWSPLPRPAIAAAGVAGSVAQWPRRRRPQVAALVGAGSFVVSGNPAPLLAGLYSGAAYAPRRQVWLLAVAAWAGLAGLTWLDAGRLTLGNAAGWALVVGLVVAVGVHVATRDLLTASLRERAERSEAERLLREEQARAAERTRIAREMHDVLAHKVSLIALHAGALELHATGDPARVRQGAALIRVTAREALKELREVLGVLQATPGGPDRQGGWFPDLASLVQASTRAGQRVELRDDAGPLPPATARVVYRIVQEGLTNAHRHAPGAPTTVSVRGGNGGEVTVTVHNAPAAGAPIDLPGSGSGLVGLAERIRLVGGSLGSGPSGPDGRDGWRLQAVVPWLDHRVDEAVNGSLQ
jgi:signal transduction histidine kinase